jgi:pimeloyl-ACP methyl ester carboxylesterase
LFVRRFAAKAREVSGKGMLMGSSAATTPEGPGSVSGAPNLNEQRKTRRLTVPVLAIGGAESSGEGVGNTMKLAADDVQTLVIPGCGHWVAEQAPEDLLAALTAFLAPYRDETPAE